MTIAVDFDGTIVRHAYPKIGQAYPFAFDALKALAAEGHHIILWTVREGKLLDEAVSFCRSYGLEFYAVNSPYPQNAWEGKCFSRKLPADLYIDDKNVGGCPSWPDIYSLIHAGEPIPAYNHVSSSSGLMSWLKDKSVKFKAFSKHYAGLEK